MERPWNHDRLQDEVHRLVKRANHFEERIHDLEEQMDTFVFTPWWKKLWFIFDGWPLYRLVDHPQWRPWHMLSRR